jgi:hypothetical protein
MQHTWDRKAMHSDLMERKPLGTPKLRWEDNIKIDLKEARWEIVNLAQNSDQ